MLGKRKDMRIRRQLNRNFVWVILVTLVLASSASSSAFMTSTNVTNLIKQSAVLGMISLGAALVIISGGFDLSIGSMVALASVLSALVVVASQNVLLAVVATVAACAFLGSLNGFMVAKMKLPPFIATFGMMGVARGIALTITKGYAVSGIPENFNYLGKGEVGSIPVPGLFLAGLLVVMLLVMKYLRFGRHVLAVGGGETAARWSGIDPDGVRLAVYTISGATAGLAGVIYAARIETGLPYGAEGYEMYAIAAALIGGVNLSGGEGSMLGVVAGAVILTIISNIMNLMAVSPYVQGAVQGVIILSTIYVSLKGRAWR